MKLKYIFIYVFLCIIIGSHWTPFKSEADAASLLMLVPIKVTRDSLTRSKSVSKLCDKKNLFAGSESSLSYSDILINDKTNRAMHDFKKPWNGQNCRTSNIVLLTYNADIRKTMFFQTIISPSPVLFPFPPLFQHIISCFCFWIPLLPPTLSWLVLLQVLVKLLPGSSCLKNRPSLNSNRKLLFE